MSGTQSGRSPVELINNYLDNLIPYESLEWGFRDTDFGEEIINLLEYEGFKIIKI